AAVATLYALFVGLFVHRQLKLNDLPDIFIRAAITSSVILFIIATASVFSWLMAIEDIPGRIAASLLALTDNSTVLLVLVNILLLAAGVFVETTAALILLVPILVNILPCLDVDIIQLGVIVVVNLAIGMLTPPLGICLIVSSGIAGSRLENAVQKVFPLLLVLLLDLVVITFWPPLTMWLPAALKY
ncbi:MAG: TRAP transporter large permease subunit, partial [Desulforhabdus sp.]|nr:TRAP transporter large permease subunit [Desulforhabdus sp.]